MKKLIKFILSFGAILTLTSCSEKFSQLDNSFINSFCKVEFLCYQNEPNWLGVILLLFLAAVLILIISAILMLLPEAIAEGIRETLAKRKEDKKRRKEDKKREQEELKQLDGKQKVFRVVVLFFKSIGNRYSGFIVWVMALAILGMLIKWY
jgi:cadmium resistance protein CadD (predicted permease)